MGLGVKGPDNWEWVIEVLRKLGRMSIYHNFHFRSGKRK